MKHILYFIIGILVIGIVFGALFGIMYLLGHYVCPLFGYNTYHPFNMNMEDDLFYGFSALFMIIAVPTLLFMLYIFGRTIIKGDIDL